MNIAYKLLSVRFCLQVSSKMVSEFFGLWNWGQGDGPVARELEEYAGPFSTSSVSGSNGGHGSVVTQDPLYAGMFQDAE